MMSKSFSILLVAAILLQSMLGGLAAAGTICLGGGHEHPPTAASDRCELDCSHASETTSLPSPVAESHDDCSCVDLELSVSDLLATLPRLEMKALPDALLASVARVTLPLADWTVRPCLSHVPRGFDPGGTQRIADLSTTRLLI